MRIGELGQATAVDVETIRYYEKVGLLPPPARSGNGYRSYGAAHVERLSFIRHCRALDMPLAEVRRLLDFLNQPFADCADVDRLIDEQLVRGHTRIKSLQALERQLTALRSCCAVAHTAADCGILRELVTAAHQEARIGGDTSTESSGRGKSRSRRADPVAGLDACIGRLRRAHAARNR